MDMQFLFDNNMTTPLLSILIPGKNASDYHGSFDRLRLNLTKTLSNVQHYDNIEVVLCDWGSEDKIVDSLNLTTSDKFKCVYVKPEIASIYNRETQYSIVHPINTAFRASTGKYVIFWDTDCYVTAHDFDKIVEFVKVMEKTDDQSFYWGSRFHIPYEFHQDKILFSDVDEYLTTVNMSSLLHDKISVSNFLGCGIAMLMNRELWESSTGFWEELTYWGWQDIEFHRRLLTKYKFSGDLEDRGINFFHLNHHHITNSEGKRVNAQINSESFKANDENWGLSNEQLIWLE